VRAWLIALLAAVVFHGAILLFGGVFFMKPEAKAETVVEDVDLMTEDAEQEQTEEAEPEPEPAELEVAEEPPPVPVEVEQPAEPQAALEPTDFVQRLDALSLGALEGALSGGGSGGDSFGLGGSLASGGRIGGTGALGATAEDPSDEIFDITMLDQQARLVHKVPPTYPPELRQAKIEGTVYVVFVVDKDGRVEQPTIESSPHQALDGPVLEAVRRWRFEPAQISGEKVRSKMRVPIRFAVSG
jgi:protein TonB